MNSTKIQTAVVAFAAFVLTAQSALADVILYATSREESKLVKINLTTNTVSDFHVTHGEPDSLILVSGGRFIYTANTTNELRLFDSVANTDTLLASETDGINSPQDLVLDPSGSFVLVSNFLAGTITKTTLTTPPVTTVLVNLPFPEGMVFDLAGNLYAFAGWGPNGKPSNLYQINPSTGSILRQTTNSPDPTNTLDGMAYDPSTNRLFGSSQGGNAMYSIDVATFVFTKIPTVDALNQPAPVPQPDGVITDGKGLLYIASRDFHVYTVNLATNLVTQLTAVPGLDDLGNIAISTPTLNKSFSPTTIRQLETSVLSFTVSNPNAFSAIFDTSLTNVAFSDTLPDGMKIANPNVLTLTGSCPPPGNITAAAGSGFISFTERTLAPGAFCTFSVKVVGTTVGRWLNTTSAVNSDEGAGNTASDTLIVQPVDVGNPPIFTKTFIPSTIPLNGSSVLTFTIAAPHTNALAAVGFNDTLPTGLIVASPNGLTGSCPSGTITAVPGSNSISLSGAALAVSATCTFSVIIVGVIPGVWINTIGSTTSDHGPGTAPSASLTVMPPLPPGISKAFSPFSIPVSGTAVLSFKLTNPNPFAALTGIGFSDPLPDNVIVATPNGLSGTCSGVITASEGSALISLSGGALDPGKSCTFTVNVIGTSAGIKNNITSLITSTEVPTGGNAATATLTVGAPDDVYQVRYASNLDLGDAVINITNSGASGAGQAAGSTAATTGAICANVYAFSPDEQMIACCSCPVTPNALVSLSAQRDLITNTLTLAIPTSIVIKLLASSPVANSCNNSAAAPGTLTPGMLAWGTTIHVAPAAEPALPVTETPFVRATLSPGELAHLTQLCLFINGNGSGFGICKSCRLGGLGGSRN